MQITFRDPEILKTKKKSFMKAGTRVLDSFSENAGTVIKRIEKPTVLERSAKSSSTANYTFQEQWKNRRL